MRPARSLLIYTIVVFAGGALIAPWLYWLVQSLAPNSHLAQTPFHRFLDRSLLGVALLGIWPLLRSLGITWPECGLVIVSSSRRWKLLTQGFALGFGSLATAAIIAIAAHARTLNTDLFLSTNKILAKFAATAATAAVVAILEEILFRGAIFGALRKAWNWRIALLVSSMIYAIVHFLAKADLPGPVTWTSGLRLLPLKLTGFGDLPTLIPGFFNLTLAGVLLGLAYYRTGNLYFSIGLHAGWIFWLKSYGVLTSPITSSNTWLWGTDKLIDGWLALAVLAVALFILLRLLPDKSRHTVP
ncbi:MAG TPA: CPBP family intramembrane glutamic endopeptidase [Candidatus Cybelea sp.]|jgi:membrane protease YdiL (CAAX protease family)|nr:CPBP family intramembrane glutamic endopeptidase [Candidatus Cybelea sp.]